MDSIFTRTFRGFQTVASSRNLEIKLSGVTVESEVLSVSLDKYENQLLKTTDRNTATCILPLHLLFVLSRIRDFYHETKEQVLLREFTKRKKYVFATAFFMWV
ncbi:hypothetical protein QTP88_008143 [Uroleucon formosanum]